MWWISKPMFLSLNLALNPVAGQRGGSLDGVPDSLGRSFCGLVNWLEISMAITQKSRQRRPRGRYLWW
jgi:hypothetical protein